MLAQKQPDDASCLVTAFAMVCDIPVADLIAQIGVDHRQPIGSNDSHDYRGHNIQDIVQTIFQTHSITEITDISVAGNCQTDSAKTKQAIIKALYYYDGVLALKAKNEPFGHTVAWVHNCGCFDPATSKHMALRVLPPPHSFAITKEGFFREVDIEVFWIVEKRP